jgi:tetratricopeptide (TPR) repeat protein
MKRALALFVLALVLVAAPARAESPGDLVAKMTPGASEAPAKALATGTFDVEQLGAELDLLAKTGEPGKIAETIQAVAKAAGAKYWRDDFDLVAGLVALGAADADAYRALIGTACILQTLAKDGRKDAVGRMIRVVPDHGGMLRFEIARRMKALGEKAIAPLILARSDKATRGFAWQTLDAMQKKIPGDAVQTKSNEILAAILSAYGETKDADALGVVMSFISSERDEVRAAARTALLAYGDAALAKLRETYGNVMNAPPPNDWTAERIARAIFDVLDKQRLAEVDALVDDGLARGEKDDVEGAVQDFDKVLARLPFIARRTLMAPAYARLALKLAATDRDAARVAFRKSLDLDPNGTHAAEVRAELEVMDGEDLATRGIDDRAPFERALAIDPGNTKARTALDRIDAKSRASEDRSRKWMWAALAGAAFLVVLVLFGRIPRRFRRA